MDRFAPDAVGVGGGDLRDAVLAERAQLGADVAAVLAGVGKIEIAFHGGRRVRAANNRIASDQWQSESRGNTPCHSTLPSDFFNVLPASVW